MNKIKNYNNLKKFCMGFGASLFGVADIKSIKKDFFISQALIDKFDKAICIGIRLSSSILNDIDNAPTRLYFHHYRTVNMALDQLALRITDYIQNKGFNSLAIPASQIVDWQKQTAHLSHRHVGVLAGMGWIGRNNLLVNNSLGSQFRLTTILTDMPLKTNKPVKENCGSCKLCVIACPAEAIKDTPQAFEFDKCFTKLKDFQKQRLAEQYICGVCIKACKGRKIY